MSAIEEAFKTSLTTFTNPFLKEKIDWVDIHIHRPDFMHKKMFTAKIWFKNNDTSGIQDFSNDDFNSLITEMQKFIDSL